MIQEITDRLNFIKIKNLPSAKARVKKMRRQVTNWKKVAKQSCIDWISSTESAELKDFGKNFILSSKFQKSSLKDKNYIIRLRGTV